MVNSDWLMVNSDWWLRCEDGSSFPPKGSVKSGFYHGEVARWPDGEMVEGNRTLMTLIVMSLYDQLMVNG